MKASVILSGASTNRDLDPRPQKNYNLNLKKLFQSNRPMIPSLRCWGLFMVHSGVKRSSKFRLESEYSQGLD